MEIMITSYGKDVDRYVEIISWTIIKDCLEEGF